jgi:hypothetical protein
MMSDETTTRPRHYWREVIKGRLDVIRKRFADNANFTAEMKARMDYIEAIIYFANSAGRDNQWLDLPDNFSVKSIEALFGIREGAESSSAEAWRALRKRYDASVAGGSRTR